MKHLLKLSLLAGLAFASTGPVACSTVPPEEPVATLERAERVDSLCLQLNRPANNQVGYEPLPEPLPVTADNCNAPRPDLVTASEAEAYSFHTFAVVPTTLRGQLGAIDLTIFRASDTDRSTPGFNYLTVGESPTDVAVTPDSRWVFVASAAAQKPGLYGVPSIYLVGDSRNADATAPQTPDLFGCALPQAPRGLAVVPNGSDADSPYDIYVTLPGDRLTPARVVAVDSAAFRHPRPTRGAGPTPSIEAGTFGLCPLKYTLDVQILPPPDPSPDLEWSDGVAYLDHNAREADTYPLPAACHGVGDDPDAGTDRDPEPDAGDALEPHLPDRPAHLGSSTQDGSILYVADLDNPIIHVFDLSLAPPVELAPLEVISSADPSGTSSVRAIAVSPPTRAFKRYLYAVEEVEGSLLVYDVTDKAATYRKPLVRPHADLQPFQPVDRVTFAHPINAIAFARHDVPLSLSINDSPTQVSGLLCNPNPDPEGDPGKLYVESNTAVQPALGPKRLRGVFGFAALSTGDVVVLDVDDWDAPCRRPSLLSDDPRASSISEPQISKAGDPYGAPLLVTPGAFGAVSREAYFPVSAPHRARSQFLLRNENDTEGGDRIPRIPGGIALSVGNTPLDSTGVGSPLIRPTKGLFADPSGQADALNTTAADGGTTLGPGVRFSYELPDVHVDQDWAVAYEGALPGFNRLRGQLTTDDGYQTMLLGSPETSFCALGVEDVTVARERADTFDAAEAAAGLPVDPLLHDRVGDYVQVTDDLLPVDDQYWLLDDNSCWGPVDASIPGNVQGAGRGLARRNFCEDTFGDPRDALTSRDFPVLEASTSRLRLGRYRYPADATNSVRERTVLGADASNEGLMSALQCCFHNQVSLNLRAGGTWLAFGSVTTYLHHMIEDASGRCVQSCESRERLLNSRIFALPREILDGDPANVPVRSSVLAMRNPMFSYVMVDGRDGAGRSRPERDVVWRFQSRNQFQALALTLTSTQSTSNPRAMRYVPALGQVILLDGASQGLTLIDLRTVAFAAGPVF